jgi:hypothetical protein
MIEILSARAHSNLSINLSFCLNIISNEKGEESPTVGNGVESKDKRSRYSYFGATGKIFGVVLEKLQKPERIRTMRAHRQQKKYESFRLLSHTSAFLRL